MSAPESTDVIVLIETTRQENVRTDTKAAALLAVVGIGFTGFSVAAATATSAGLRGLPMVTAMATLVLITVSAEILLMVIRPSMRYDGTADRYFWQWAEYADCPDRLAAELGADVAECRLLVRLSVIVRRKYRLLRRAVDLLLVSAPLLSIAVGATLVGR